MRNRLALAGAALLAAVAAQVEGDEARAFVRAGLPILLAYLLGASLIRAHIAWRPLSSAPRLALGFAMDGLAITAAMSAGGGAAAYLFPLYGWLILGAGARLGAAFLAFTVALAALGFGVVVAQTPFWRDHAAFAASLLLSILVLPLYGAALLRHVAAARAEAERANRAKTMFLASVSHELRTPLTAIIGLTGLLENSPLDSGQRDMSRTLSEAARTLLRQIEHLLAGAREEMSGERGAPQDETVDLFALLISLKALLSVEAEAKGVRLGLLIEGQTPRHIRGDRRRLHEILQNVAGNAVKFTREGAVAIRVGARRAEDGLWLNVEISDTGPGVAPEARTRIFEPFEQGDPSIRAQFGGAGLGLDIVRRRLREIDGEIALVSRPGEGARFRLRWPAREVEEGEETKAPAAPGAEPVCLPVTDTFDALAVARRRGLAVLVRGDDASAFTRARRVAAQLAALRGSASGPTLKILLAEDNAVNRRVLEKIILGAGHRARVVADGEDALRLMLREDFDVILLDVNMPRLGGVETARIYAASKAGEGARAPVLALTADDSAEARRACRDAGMIDCLRKPIALETLVAALDAAKNAAPPPFAPRARGEDLDAARLSALTRLGGVAFLRDLLVQFAADAARQVEHIEESLARGDVARLRRQAHALESMAGNMGAGALARLCGAWRAMDEERLSLSAARETERLRRRWRMTQDALGRALGQTLGETSAVPCK